MLHAAFGALAEELGMGLQNPVHGCESRTRLHELWASGGIGIRSGLKIRAARRAGSSPASPTNIKLSDFFPTDFSGAPCVLRVRANGV